jgi:PleD family two-component response regulator
VNCHFLGIAVIAARPNPKCSLPLRLDRNSGLLLALRLLKNRMAHPSEEKLKGKPVLVVEDDPQVGEILTHVLTRHGDASHASSGKEALKTIEENPPNIILLDVTLPDISGLEVAQHLRCWLVSRKVFVGR